jgi:zinc ribbon protein
MGCARCGEENADGARFCSACGARLETGSPVRANDPRPVAPIRDARGVCGAFAQQVLAERERREAVAVIERVADGLSPQRRDAFLASSHVAEIRSGL